MNEDEEKKMVKRIGNVVFRIEREMEQLRSSLGAMISKCDGSKWDLSDQKYILWDISNLIPSIEQLTIKQLYLNRVNNPRIIRQISNIRMEALTILALEGNNIASIQALTAIILPDLTVLWLAYNKIVSLRPLRKMSLLNLQWLSLHNNPIQDFSPLCQLRAPILSNLDTGILDVLTGNCQVKGAWLFKMQSIEVTRSYSALY